jgi:glyoxylase-like metal-dependent hydrolase (beta-lactamase superfamily II)
MASLKGIEVILCRVDNQKGIVKSWILHEGSTVVIVDTGQDAKDAEAIQRALERLGCSITDVSAILLTHCHGDHTGGLRFLGPHRDVVFAHPGDQQRIADDTGISINKLAVGPLLWLPDVEVISMPGHTPGTVLLYWPSRGAIIAGDAIFSTGRHLISPPDYLCDDPGMARNSIHHLISRDLTFDAVLVSHGEDVLQDGKARLHRILSPHR